MLEKLDSLLDKEVVCFTVFMPSLTIKGKLGKIGSLYFVENIGASYCYFRIENIYSIKMGEELVNPIDEKHVELETYYIELKV